MHMWLLVWLVKSIICFAFFLNKLQTTRRQTPGDGNKWFYDGGLNAAQAVRHQETLL